METLVDVLHRHAETHGDSTAFTFLADGESESDRVSFRRLHEESSAVAAHLTRRGLAGERAVLLFETSADFLFTFFGCLMARVVAVPMSLPRKGRTDRKLQKVILDSQAAVIMTAKKLVEQLHASIGDEAGPAARRIVAIEDLAEGSGPGEKPRPPAPEDIAFLQYTSGSTGNPKGVVVTHENIRANQEMIKAGFGHDERTVFGGWLPLFHDMGLVGNVFQPVFLGIPCVLMPPRVFVHAPITWLKMISRYGVTTSGSPNFGYDLCVRRIREEELGDVDLSSWTIAFNGAERVSNDTVKHFCERFAKYGFRASSMYPCYGLAEATLFVSGERLETGPESLTLDRTSLEQGIVRVLPPGDVDGGVRTFESIACGKTWLDGEISIRDPESGEPRPPGQIGEICVSGPHATAGYWNRPAETRLVFVSGSDGGPTPHVRTVRTGDLGFLDSGNRVHVTGRLKELIILNGRNLYPEDIEFTARGAHPSVAECSGAAFTVDRGGEEHLVVVHEVQKDHVPLLDRSDLVRRITSAVNREYGVTLRRIVLVRPSAIPVTSSGKIQRGLCRQLFLAGHLDELS